MILLTITIDYQDIEGSNYMTIASRIAHDGNVDAEQKAALDILQKHMRQGLEEFTNRPGGKGAWSEGKHAAKKAVNRFKSK